MRMNPVGSVQPRKAVTFPSSRLRSVASSSVSFVAFVAAFELACSSENDSSTMGGASGSSAVSTVGGTSHSATTVKVQGGSQSSATTATGGQTSDTTSGSATAGARAACQPPARYRNLFSEVLGKSQSEVDAKVKQGVDQLFHGTGSEQPIYYEMSGGNQAYIKDIANNDVRSEGQSYAMLVAVQMDMKAEFDKLWNYAASCMRQGSNLFSWQMNPGACTAISTGVAPDGDEYFAMALMLASRRWGDSTGIDYAAEAKKGLKAMANTSNGVFKASPPVVTFGPYTNYSDPSYVLPLFYSEWACFDTANAPFWNSATTFARTYFQRVTHPTTGLAPYQSNFEGTSANGTNFNADAWRVPMNIMMDHHLNNADSWQATWAARHAAFWVKEGLDSYGNGYTLSGTETSGGHGQGLTLVNAMLAFGLPSTDAKPFLERAWDAEIPTGQYRYYDGCLYMLAILHLSGKFDLFY